MINILNKTARRLFSPNRDRDFIWLTEHAIAYARVPKAANSAIKLSLHDLLFGEQLRVPNVNRDEFWRNLPDDRAQVLSAADLLRDHPNAFVFTFTRNPFSRVASCYFDKLVLNDGKRIANGLRGFSADMSFAQYVDRVASLDDEQITKHLCSMSSILIHAGRLVPQFVGRTENVLDDWKHLGQAIHERGGPRLCRLRILNKTHHKRPPTPEMFADPGLVRLVRERYRSDFEMFYADMDLPVVDVALATPRIRTDQQMKPQVPGA